MGHSFAHTTALHVHALEKINNVHCFEQSHQNNNGTKSGYAIYTRHYFISIMIQDIMSLLYTYSVILMIQAI